MFYLLSLKERHMRDDTLTWWGPGGRGYYGRLALAGQYTKEEAARHVMPGSTIAVPIGVVDVYADRVAFRGPAAVKQFKKSAKRAAK